jgi:hypothetical protein
MPFCSRCGEEVELRFCWRCGAPNIPADYELVESSADELGHRFIAQYERLDSSARVVFDDARTVFHQAIGCCKSGYYLATTVLCRETIEAMVFLAKIHTAGAKGQRTIGAEALKEISEKKVYWQELEDWAIDRKYIDEPLKNTLQTIRELGNFSAHYAEQVMRGRAEGCRTPYRMSISPEEAYFALNVSRRFIMAVIQKWVGSN